MKILIYTVVFLFSSNLYCQEEEKMIKSFFNDMLEFNELNKYVYNSNGFIIDFYLVEEYVINDLIDNVITVDLNTGGDKFWTRLYFKFHKDEKNNLFFLGKINIKETSIMSAWFEKQKIPSR